MVNLKKSSAPKLETSVRRIPASCESPPQSEEHHTLKNAESRAINKPRKL